MFLGMQNNLIALVADTREALENAKCIEFTEIVETDEPVEMVDGVYCLGATEIIDGKSKYVRKVRNSYLEMFVDPVVSNPLRWNDLSEEERKEYSDYRQYLLDYPTITDWWAKLPKTFTEWKENPEEEPVEQQEQTNE